MLPNNHKNKHQGWYVLAGSVAINVTMGVNYSWSVIKKALVDNWHWTNVEASLPYTVYSTFYAFLMIFAGRAQDKYGPRLVSSLGSVIVGIGMVSCYFAKTPLMLAASYGLVVACGFAMCYATTIPASIKWFPPEKKGFITGMVVGATGLAAVYVSPVINWTLARYGIGLTFISLGLVIMAVILTAAQFLRNPAAGYVCRASTAQAPETLKTRTSRDYCWQEMLRTTAFYKLWIMFFFASSAGLMIFGHMATITKTQTGWEGGFYLVSLLALFNTGGRMAAGVFSDKLGRIETMKWVFFLQSINLLFFPYFATPAQLAAGSMLVGLCYGACFTLFPLVTSDFYGLKNLGVNYGLMLTAWGCAGMLGPLLAGKIADLTGTYFLAYMISAVLLLAALVIAFFTHSPARNLSH